ncbi:hypothetical protein L1280_001662 [Deinococcus sp. HSC-46F16]|uniref:hypothetical protein n=1 Tax=Deinococcus sp. HSC-46F16 TaxID=2910968 RepID=UPI00209FC8DD|nr:hypothetical protein [Deinococcus sp. HSC-46F16]MCP2014511.1 hypothetical protein [Deinococcus sp. HSC-46F16]
MRAEPRLPAPGELAQHGGDGVGRTFLADVAAGDASHPDGGGARPNARMGTPPATTGKRAMRASSAEAGRTAEWDALLTASDSASFA